MRLLYVFSSVILLCVCSRARAETLPQINLRKTVVVDVVNKTKDAVVYVSTKKIVARRVDPFGGMNPFWQDFGEITRVPANSLGSGFIIHSDGYVVTNNHVIDRAREINVELLDGRKLPADLISADPDADLAILKIITDKPTTFPTIELGDSSDLMIGEPAIAVGNPLGYSHTVSTGIVSALHRDLKGSNDKVILKDLIQTDAAINPGNSGGPLLNAYGQVIGIDTAIRSDAQNIGFAIPVDRLRDLIPELMNPTQVTKVDVPIKLKEIRKDIPPAMVQTTIRMLDEKGGDGPVVTAINGQPVHTLVQAYDMLLKVNVGDKIVVTTEDGKKLPIVAVAAPQPDAIVQAKKRLGIGIEEVTPLISQRMSLPVEDGLLIKDVQKDSVAAKAGLEPGDILVAMGRFRLTGLKDLSSLLPHLPDAGRVRISVVRGDEVRTGVLEFGTSD